ncbi:hypothetical protein PBAL39_06761 [Pedobacter sp. BAL39]|nr:hypothetical protein [Pedobacter sp. BAL39]EDM35860.1 hypothetical protein PBAL39_06761 [Pedobacter sp. BAL39]
MQLHIAITGSPDLIRGFPEQADSDVITKTTDENPRIETEQVLWK